jgi:hypothetical protein
MREIEFRGKPTIIIYGDMGIFLPTLMRKKYISEFTALVVEIR